MYRIFYKTELFIGSGSLEQLKTYQNQAIFIVADPFLVQTGQLEELVETYLDSSNEIQIFSEIVPLVVGIATKHKSSNNPCSFAK